MNNIRVFPLRVVLTVTTGRLLTKSQGERDNGIGDLYEILGHMTGESPYTHTLGRFSDECKPWLLRWYPELDSAELQLQLGRLTLMLETKAGPGTTELLIVGWLSELVAKGVCREEYDVGRIPMDDHERKHPYDELVAMRGTDEGIIIIDKDGAL